MTLFLWVMLIVQVCSAGVYLWCLQQGVYPRHPNYRTPIEDALGLVGRLSFGLWAAYLLWM